MNSKKQLVLAAGMLILSACCQPAECQQPPRAASNPVYHLPASRPFRLGFTGWPADLTLEGMLVAQQFAETHGDIISVMFIGGIPWQEALEGTPFSEDVKKNLSYQHPPGDKLFLSISPLDKERKELAPRWGDKDNLPLSPPWDNLALNSPRVKTAYKNFVLRAVKAMKPDYLAIGVELNVLLSNDPVKWKQLKELYRETYAAVKAAHPKLPVFFTTEVMHYFKYAKEAKNVDQAGEVADLMKQSDLFAMSLYPYMSYQTPRPLPADFLDFALKFHKPIAVSESGMTSRDVTLKSYGITLKGSESEQEAFTNLLFQAGIRNRYRFIINFATTDFPRLCDRLPPPLGELALIWAYTGMQTDEQKPKPAQKLWDTWLHIDIHEPVSAD